MVRAQVQHKPSLSLLSDSSLSLNNTPGSWKYHKEEETHKDHVALVAHVADLGHIAHLLFDQRRLEGDEHEERKERVVPHVLETPQTHAEHL